MFGSYCGARAVIGGGGICRARWRSAIIKRLHPPILAGPTPARLNLDTGSSELFARRE